MRAIPGRLAEGEPRNLLTKSVRLDGGARFDSLFAEKRDSIRVSPIRARFVSAPGAWVSPRNTS
jgi:hypothetical protein